MTTKPNAKKPGAKDGSAGAPVKAKASADSVKKLKPADAAASGKRKAPSERPAAAKAAGKPAAPTAAAPAQGGMPSATASGRMGRGSKRGSKRGDEIGLRTNLSAEIAGLSDVVKREKEREKLQAAMASGQSIKITNRGDRETRKVYGMLGGATLVVLALFAFIIFRGWFQPPSATELAEVNGWASEKMGAALKKVDGAKIRAQLKGSTPSDDEKRKIVREFLLEQIVKMEAKAERDRENVTMSKSGKSLDELQTDLRALAVCHTMKDAYGQPWQIEFDNHDFVILKSLGANKIDDTGKGVRDAKGKSDDLVVSTYLPFHDPAAMTVENAGQPIEAPPPIDLTNPNGPPVEPSGPGRGDRSGDMSDFAASQRNQGNGANPGLRPGMRDGPPGGAPPPDGQPPVAPAERKLPVPH